MKKIVRFGVSIENELVEKFDRLIKEQKYPNRSEAIRDLIRQYLVLDEWKRGVEISGCIVMVYDHHRRELVNKLIDLQHDFCNIILSSQHIHLDHDNCLEVIIVKGNPEEIKELKDKTMATKGIKHCSFAITTTGKELV